MRAMNPECQVVDLRRDCIDCIRELWHSNYRAVRKSLAEHVHPGCVEVSLCLRGRLFFDSLGKSYAFNPGMVFVSGPKEPHRMRSCPKGLCVDGFLFVIPKPGERILDLPADESAWLTRQLTRLPRRLFPATERLRNAFDMVFAVQAAKERRSAGRRLRLKSAALELLLALVEAATRVEPQLTANAKINGIVKQICRHPEADYSLDALARQAALSTVAFNAAFKQAAGLPPHAFLIDQRIQHAERDLRTSRLSIAEIAKKYHFWSAQHFSVTYKRIVGHSPRNSGASRL